MSESLLGKKRDTPDEAENIEVKVTINNIILERQGK
jgi:hypothetical protein